MRQRGNVRVGESWQAHNDELVTKFLEDDQYRVFATGEIYTCRDFSGKPRASWRRCDSVQSNGYRRVRYKGSKLSAHRIVFLKFNGALDPLKHINHIDGVKENNDPKNLELVTPSENQTHSVRVLGNKPPAGNTRLHPLAVSWIRARREAGDSVKALAKRYGVSKSTVSYIINRKSWKDTA